MLRKVYTVLRKIPTYHWPSHHLHTLGNSNPVLGHSRISLIDALSTWHMTGKGVTFVMPMHIF